MSDLIVDFPSKGHSSSFMRAKTTVQFASLAEVRIFQHQEKFDPSDIWYSDQDYRSMKKVNRIEVVKEVHKKYLMLSTNQEGGSEVDYTELTCLAGLENLLTPKIIKKAKASRRKCLNAVLEEQSQQESGERQEDPDKLAALSRRHSEWSAKRAIVIGKLQSN